MKILIIANRCKWDSWNSKIQELKDWFNPVIDLDITLEHSDFKNIPYQVYTKESISYYGIDYNWYDQNISIPSKQKGYDVVIFTIDKIDWGGKIVDGWHTSNSHGIHEIQIGCREKGNYSFFNKRYKGDKWFNIARHELCHALYAIQGKLDRTHFHWESGDLSRVLTELTIMKPQKPVVTLTRNQDDGVQTLGEIEYNGVKLNTLELSYKDNQRNISSIPKGTYEVKYSFSPKFMKYTYELTGVPNRSSIRIHSGNYFTDIQGCILLGNGYKDINKDGRLDVINSTISINKFEQLLNKQPFTLIIK